MTMRVRTVLMLILTLVMMGLASCDHYDCTSGAVFGNSSCTASGTGLGTGTTGSATAAFAFAVDQAGTIDGYTLNTTAGTFAATTGYTAPTIPTNNGGVGMVIAQEQYVYAGFGSVGELYGWSIDSTTGGLTAITGSPFSAPFLDEFGAGVGESNMTTNPAGTLLFISDTLQDEIYVYQIGTGGALTLATGSPFTVPFPPMNLSTDGLGKYLYAIDGNFDTHTGSEIAAFVIGTTGSLTAVPGSPFIQPMWIVKGEPTGNFMIGTSGRTLAYSGSDDDNLYVFSITQSGANAGAIAPVTGSPFATTYTPYSIAVQSNSGGNLVYSLGFNDALTGFNPVEGYQISSTGTLTAVTGSPFSSVAEGSWGQFDQSGAFLFAYSSYVDSSTNDVTTLLGVDEVGSGGALTEPITSLTLATPGFWVVTDPQ
jgi:6-phosphogluconolactonase